MKKREQNGFFVDLFCLCMVADPCDVEKILEKIPADRIPPKQEEEKDEK